MKTTFKLPDALLRKATAGARGISMKASHTGALEAKLATVPQSANPVWMQGFGKLKHLRRETRRIQAVNTREFGLIEAEDCE